MQAIITTYRSHLVIQLLAKSSIPGAVKTSLDNPESVGQTILCSETNLGVSKEAAAMLAALPRGTDEVGDLFWKRREEGRCIFAWRGKPLVALHPSTCRASSFFAVQRHVVIDNDDSCIPGHLKLMLDAFAPVEIPVPLRMAA